LDKLTDVLSLLGSDHIGERGEHRRVTREVGFGADDVGAHMGSGERGVPGNHLGDVGELAVTGLDGQGPIRIQVKVESGVCHVRRLEHFLP